MFMHFRPAIVLFVLLSLLTGAIYPAAVTALAQAWFPEQANGSLISNSQNQVLGSALIGQSFSDPKYFWGRPSATTPYPYNAAASGGSNLGPTHPALAEAVKARIAALRVADPDNRAPLPVDLVTSSGSGLDPHISPAAAEYQLGRVARARGQSVEKIRDLVRRHTENRQIGLLGEPRVHVLRLNLALDAAPLSGWPRADRR
ncbi:potassium-transporting ATPase subunit KdpC [Methylococcus sp. EFPC2]|uniref:potassium-transporting ATPase subunit KdpC n=1 Tax=Methylococcus sp. EFPC2 TaxID=2812648 RepID=UPI0019672A95|nr:potassium-transporting ATPase subunit KdpC [Methylococcus sp. EFPC2]QSA97165.1 potassium-transporting ATPase subunit KdpC [Methylococcus sp. EFPC2]